MKDFEKIYSEYYDTVFQYALSLCRDEQWAEEITQDAFFKALKSIDTFRGECKLSVWLCQIAKNTFYTAAKRQQRQVDYPLELIPAEETIEQKLLYKEAALQIHKQLHSLDQPYKEVFWMRTFGELSFKEIGILFGKTESWARVTYHRAKVRIKEGVK
ncbi:MAG TPA: RNA polymerase sigma factor [Bacillota bacterium]|nr:RNA polymerase sigma factor [Candidatus Fermentithermobacillaceae bacterium]HOB30661.1 RNA polymerase sigma factor [Bacillota bacterium]HOQ03134.1 RNA polymerase sigma factor [Bacillota bacterium]HPV13530.1 RNA polymerase sigma factor [Bacillota bacterium]HPZ78295.1 RNA polymerase sigma factor [Bacillota bacterium]